MILCNTILSPLRSLCVSPRATIHNSFRKLRKSPVQTQRPLLYHLFTSHYSLSLWLLLAFLSMGFLTIHAATSTPDVLTVAIFDFDSKDEAVHDLGPKVADLESKKTNPGDDKSVYLRADQRANYGKVMDTIDAIRTAGVSEVNLLTAMTSD